MIASSEIPETVDVAEFLTHCGRSPVIDVRSPAEFAYGRIRGAENLPLFSDAERSSVGTTYKTAGREAATLAGLGFVGPRLESLAKSARDIALARSVDHLLVHCWRGGMRSASMAWLFRTAGLGAVTLQGGYKAYRRFMQAALSQPRALVVIGGHTGAGKTELLNALCLSGEQTIDLESLVQHRGSSFGSLGYSDQPSNEQFENELGEELHGADGARPTWVEDESQKVGRNFIPDSFYNQMKSALMVFVEAPLEDRIARLVEAYGGFGLEPLREATVRIRKRLGGERTARAVDAIEKGNHADAVRIILDYYDRAYSYGVEKRHLGPILRLPWDRSKTSVTTAAGLFREAVATHRNNKEFSIASKHE